MSSDKMVASLGYITLITNSLSSMKIDIVPLVVIVFCLGVAVSALMSSEVFTQTELPVSLAQVQE
jgi:biopolymer transport protein ExbD